MLLRYLSHSLPPLLILCGPEGTGRWSSAEALVRQSLCELGNSCGQCAQCRKIEHGSHPDYIQFPPSRIAIGNQDKPERFTVRWLLQSHLPYAPFDGNRRFVIFPRADLIQHEAETALLKTLEDTPMHTRFIFLVESKKKLKPTILSRGVVVPFQYLSQEALLRLGDADFNETERNFLGGSFQHLRFLTVPLVDEMDRRIREGLSHPLSLLDLESWLVSGEKNCFRDLCRDEEFSYAEILEIFGLRLLVLSRGHERGSGIARAVLEFKGGLHKDLAGMLPFYRGRLFFELDQVLFA